MSSVIPVLIPAYNPPPELADFVRTLLREVTHTVIIVNDGSSPSCIETFAQIKTLSGVVYGEHSTNLGKGQALKTGLKLWQEQLSGALGVVTADADGQHTPTDIKKIIAALSMHPEQLVLGVRQFNRGIPWRSRMGNIITRQIFYWLTGCKLQDTQTGLRGIPRQFIKRALAVPGPGYEYETQLLLTAVRTGMSMQEVPISTVYIADNRSSHFHPLLDSMRIYWVLLRYVFSSLLAAAIDFGFFSLIINWIPNITICMLISRYVIGALVNFTVNRTAVFQNQSSVSGALLKYYMVATVMGLLASGGVILLVDQLRWSIMVSKIVIEVILFPVGFILQRNWVFMNLTKSAK